MARINRKTILMWALYALFFLIVLLVQDAVLSKFALRGARVVLAPLTVYCTAAHTDAEKGGLFGLLAGLFWALVGAADGGLMLFCMTFGGVLCGYLCSSWSYWPCRRRCCSRLLRSDGGLRCYVIQGE